MKDHGFRRLVLFLNLPAFIPDSPFLPRLARKSSPGVKYRERITCPRSTDRPTGRRDPRTLLRLRRPPFVSAGAFPHGRNPVGQTHAYCDREHPPGRGG